MSKESVKQLKFGGSGLISEAPLHSPTERGPRYERRFSADFISLDKVTRQHIHELVKLEKSSKKKEKEKQLFEVTLETGSGKRSLHRPYSAFRDLDRALRKAADIKAKFLPKLPSKYRDESKKDANPKLGEDLKQYFSALVTDPELCESKYVKEFTSNIRQSGGDKRRRSAEKKLEKREDKGEKQDEKRSDDKKDERTLENSDKLRREAERRANRIRDLRETDEKKPNRNRSLSAGMRSAIEPTERIKAREHRKSSTREKMMKSDQGSFEALFKKREAEVPEASADFSTIRIKDSPREDSFSTIRVKDDDAPDFSTVRKKDDSVADFSTCRVKDEPELPIKPRLFDRKSQENVFVMQPKRRSLQLFVKEEKPKEEPLAKDVSSSQSSVPDFLKGWKAPESWELNIISLEKGEWGEDMNEDVFRKYKKNRPRLSDVLSQDSSGSEKGSDAGSGQTSRTESIIDAGSGPNSRTGSAISRASLDSSGSAIGRRLSLDQKPKDVMTSNTSSSSTNSVTMLVDKAKARMKDLNTSGGSVAKVVSLNTSGSSSNYNANDRPKKRSEGSVITRIGD